jgi:sulfopyruvate decarboxylase subunit alpha
MDGPRLIVNSLKRIGVELVLVVPDEWSRNLIQMIEDDPSMTLLYVTREEEGFGVAAGAFLGGKKAAMIMQTSGLGNSINVLASLNLVYQIPVVVLASFRGGPGEEYYHKLYVGTSIKQILSALRIPCYEISSEEQIGEVITNSFIQSESSNTPIVVLIEKRILRGENE